MKNIILAVLAVASTIFNFNANAAAVAAPSMTASLVVPSSTAPQFVPVGNSGATNATKATFNFLSTGGSSTISELKFYVVNGQYTLTSISVAGISAPVVNGVVWLTGLNLSVPDGGAGLNQDVFVSYPGVSPNGILSGAIAQFELEYIKYSSGGVTYTTCATFEQGTCDSVMDVVIAPAMMLVGSRPVVSSQTFFNPVVIGLNRVGTVTVAVDPKGDITLNQIPVQMTLSPGVNVGGSLLLKDSNGNTVATTDTKVTATQASIVSFVGGNQLAAGTSQTFSVLLPIASIERGDGSEPYAYLSLGSSADFGWTDVAGRRATPFLSENGKYLFNYNPPPAPEVSARITSILPTMVDGRTMFEIRAQATSGVDWWLESSKDFQNWKPLWGQLPRQEGIELSFIVPLGEGEFFRLRSY